MENKKGISKIAIVLIVFAILIVIGVGTFLTIWLIQKNNQPPVEVQLYEDYTEGEVFVDEDSVGDEMTPLANGLKEYRNDELGVRFGYLSAMSTPVDEESEDGTYISTIKDPSKSTTIVLRVGKIDVSQPDIDHIQKQKDALTQELTLLPPR